MLRPVAAAGLAVLVLAAAAPAVSAQEPRLARIAYSADERLYTIAADGSDRRLVSDAPGRGEPAWSPDGATLATTRYANDFGGTRIWLSAPDGSGARPLTAPPRGDFELSPTWSPDGRRVAFVRVRYGDEQLVTTLVSAAVAGGDERRIARIASSRFVGMMGADWSPDGRQILVSVGDVSNEQFIPPELHVVDVAQGTRRRVLRRAEDGEWSPAGDRIAYVGWRPGCEEDACEEIYLANADGGGRRRLTTNEARDTKPTWAPGGERIAFASDRNYPEGGSAEIYTMGLDGSCLTWLTNGTARVYAPAFERGAGPLSSDPGACGATAREPLIETDTSDVSTFDHEPIWWLGPRHGNLLISDAEEESGNADFSYADCAAYEPSDCPLPIELTNLPACAVSLGFGSGAGLSRHDGALLDTQRFGDEESYATLVAGPTAVFLGPGGAPLEPLLNALRRFGEDAPPAGGLPRAELPARLFRGLERTRAAVRKYGRSGAQRRLRRSRRKIANDLALDRRLRALGPFGRLGCGR